MGAVVTDGYPSPVSDAAPAPHGGSPSILQPDYWWYRARSEMLRSVLGPYVGDARRLLDVGSADGPSVGWLTAPHKVSLDLDPRGLRPPSGVCGSLLALPFADAQLRGRQRLRRDRALRARARRAPRAPPGARARRPPARRPCRPTSGPGATTTSPTATTAATPGSGRWPRSRTPASTYAARPTASPASSRCSWPSGPSARRATASPVVRTGRPTSSTCPRSARSRDGCCSACAGSTSGCSPSRDLPFGSSVFLAAVKS